MPTFTKGTIPMRYLILAICAVMVFAIVDISRQYPVPQSEKIAGVEKMTSLQGLVFKGLVYTRTWSTSNMLVARMAKSGVKGVDEICLVQLPFTGGSWYWVEFE